MALNMSRTLIYRMIHYKNLEGLLTHGIHCANSEQRVPNYINIGDTELIEKRKSIPVDKEPFGTLDDYVPFYFCPRSPMLYKIKNNFEIYKCHQSEIIYLVSSVEKIEESGLKYVFTDAHAYTGFKKFYNQKNELVNLDWEVLKSDNWAKTALDPDRKRRKQAEFLIYETLPFESLEGIGVFVKTQEEYVKEVLLNHDKKLYTGIKKDWYYL